MLANMDEVRFLRLVRMLIIFFATVYSKQASTRGKGVMEQLAVYLNSSFDV